MCKSGIDAQGLPAEWSPLVTSRRRCQLGALDEASGERSACPLWPHSRGGPSDHPQNDAGSHHPSCLLNLQSPSFLGEDIQGKVLGRPLRDYFLNIRLSEKPRLGLFSLRCLKVSLPCLYSLRILRVTPCCRRAVHKATSLSVPSVF